ncbi:NDP-sugar dehydrogenase [Insulibacter thermoxylanivorax]|uniref:NDP-sugar dehydrogenase n=1 Tax=Insulibacter thermoxylanivorax TaxID=2749268 RepID=A0A916QIW7_9BACL|nr:nucleotide sugar dehydrogenase [Insulibacter thermoxylanivorax]GFR39436.1 NDP-sugar dehydrogenase [Insulibacter thermoxylanivorax]
MEQQRTLAVLGLGFIGLPLSLSYAMHGAKVIGIDVLPGLIEDINNGITHHMESYQGRTIRDILKEQIAAGRFRATSDYAEAAREVDTYVITVGIPIKDGEPDFRALDNCCESLGSVLKRGDTVIVRSTVVPGTTEGRIKPKLEEKSGLKAGEDFYLAYSSERIAEGRAFEEFISMPLALGGVNEASIEKARDVLSFVTKAEITISDILTVETAKVIENIQRDVNIAMVQQFARFAEKAGIDTFELIRVANTHKRVNLLMPGPGVGGYCLPNALYYLRPKARELGVAIDLLEMARRINDEVPGMLVDMLESALHVQGKELTGSTIAMLGLAMKDYSNDDRISPAHDIVKILLERGAKVRAWDPAVKSEYDYKVDTLEEAVTGADALLYVTAQEEFQSIDWSKTIELMADGAVLIDAKNRIPRDLPAGTKLYRI